VSLCRCSLNFGVRRSVRAAVGGWRRTPRNVRCIERILDFFPQALVIVIRRDGRDVVCSLKARGFMIEDGAKRWLHDNALADAFIDHPRVSFIRYEDLVNRGKEAISELLDFLGEDSLDLLQLYNESRQTATADDPKPTEHNALRKWQLGREIYNGGGRWRKELNPEEIAIVEDALRARLTLYDYE